MTIDEFKEVLILTDITSQIGTKMTPDGTYADMYLWEGFTIYFMGKSRVIVDGKIPYEVAKTIEENYDLGTYGIFYNLNSFNDKLENHVFDDKFYERFDSYVKKHPYENTQVLLKKGREEQRNVLKRNTQKYIKNYYITTKEGLFIFINEYKKYLLRLNNGRQEDINSYDKEIKSYINSYKREK